MSLVARVIRQFHEGQEFVSLERTVALPHMPTMGTRLDLRIHGVEAALEVVAVTFAPRPTGLASANPPLGEATLAREGGWRDAA